MNILLLGANGQVGQAWVELSKTEKWPKGFQLIAWDRTQADFSDPEKLFKTVAELHKQKQLGLIINTVAFTQVDLAETERKNCRLINAISPGNLADFCVHADIPLIHYSTDYVYSGEGSAPHSEDEHYSPLNYYGLTKSEGDHSIEESGAKFLIFRTSWVYSHQGKNFVLTMLKHGKEREQLKVVDDQVGAPTYAPDLAAYSLEVLKKALVLQTVKGEFPSGVYHLSNSDFVSWFGFAEEIFKQARAVGMELKVNELSAIPSSEYPTPAKRPLNSRLSMDKILSTFQVKPRSWKDALAECLKRVKEKA